MSILEPTIVEATTNTVTVVVTNNYDTISVVQPQVQSVVVRDSVIRGPEGPQGPQGVAGPQGPQGPGAEALQVANAAYSQANAAYSEANLKLNLAGGTVTGSLNVNQDLSVLGNISVNGHLTIGNQITDTVNVIADFSSNLIPDVTQQFNLGSANQEWKELYVQTATVNGNLTVTGTTTTRNITPDANVTYSIGTPENRYKDIYLANSTIYIGDAILSANGKEILVSDNNGNTIALNASSQSVNTTYLSANVVYTGPIATTFNVFTTTSDSIVTVDSFLSSEYTTVKYIVQVKSIEGVHACELFCMHDGVSTYLTEFATLITSHSLGIFSMELQSGLVKLNFDPYNPENNILTIKMVRQAITL
jgi:hypothetical protein